MIISEELENLPNFYPFMWILDVTTQHLLKI